ncbi:MAG: tRNA (adenosine(37)-N6)-dimethylallyltransferase MiaA [Saprospiraceae bacterium]|nr:tRNA (adenosine(37)-N6)-dimethylallyltransferase MiaA [Saprospiraceae bacterium]
MHKSKELIIIAGPTASGKSALAVDVALEHQAEVFSADSRQIYRELNIGVAKPTEAEMLGVHHHFIGHTSIHELYDAGTFEQEAIRALEQYFQNGDSAVMAGGTGFYLKAITHGLDFFPAIDESVNAALAEELSEKGLAPLCLELQQKDKLTFDSIDLNNARRVLRALSVIRSTGKPFSAFKKGERKERPFAIRYHYIDLPREILYARIDDRVDRMIAAGLLEEARSLFPHRGLKALETVGYQELFDHFEGQCTLDDAVDKIKQHSRNYAKRQVTWFKKYNEEMASFRTSF